MIYWHVKITGLFFASHFQILIRKPDTKMFHLSSRSSIPIDLPFCTTCVMLWRCFMHSPHIHRSCLTLLDVTSGGRYRWIWLTFWTFIIHYILWLSLEYLSLNNLCLLKEENMPVARNTNSFPEIVNFLGVWAVVNGNYGLCPQHKLWCLAQIETKTKQTSCLFRLH
jgi:hypothetical protein